MVPAIRTICRACLQSLELTGGDERLGYARCPYCGSRVDLSDLGRDDSTSEGFNSPPPSSHPDSVTPKDGPPSRLPPSRIARFVIREPLGEGGYGQVFRAYDPHLDRDVALKVLKPTRLGEKAMERFYREARAAARLDHPHIVGLHDAGCDDGRCWIAYQLVPGRTLSVIRDLDRPSVEASVRIVRDLALALDHAHGRGVFHRDLKPANVLVDDSGRARLTDFGLARRDDIDSDLTREGTVLGTPQYMSPEAAAGRAHQADARSDVYSLGVILYELLCGRRPADLPSGAPLWRSTKLTSMPTPRSVDRAIPQALDRICMKALAFQPEARFATAGALAEALTQYAPARPSRVPPRRSVDIRGLAIALVVGASTLCLILGMSVHVTSQPFGPARIPSALVSRAVPDPIIPTSAPTPRPDPRPTAPAKPPEVAREVARPAFEELSPTPDLAAEPVVWIRGTDGLIVHLARGCQHTSRTNPAKLVEMGDARSAMARGYKPCKSCLKTLSRSVEAAPTGP